MQTMGAGKMHELLRGNLSTHDFTDLLLHQPYVHAKEMTQAEYEAEHGPLDGGRAVRAR
jgi:hypothetical protein